MPETMLSTMTEISNYTPVLSSHLEDQVQMTSYANELTILANQINGITMKKSYQTRPPPSAAQTIPRRKRQKSLNFENMNQFIKQMEFAVKGPLAIRAGEIEKELKQGIEKPFKEVIRANIGDCHAMGQKPITFIRQVVALCSYPSLMNDDKFPDDVKLRAKRVLDGCKGSSVGSYSDGPGVESIRRDVADFIARRDNIPSDYDDVFLCAGASEGIRSIMKLLVNVENGKPSGVMIPIPQYPLYTASMAEFNMHPINYYLNEDKNWALDLSELERSIEEAKKDCIPRAIVVINPGNPTGQVLTRQNIEQIIKFAFKENLFILADEVYQDNIHDEGSEFHSFKKVMMELGAPYNTMELASFMSTSKGYMGECGLRGGFTEVVNMDDEVRAMLDKTIAAKLCPSVLGQAAIEAIVNPPQPHEPSYDLFIKEKTEVMESLAQRARTAETLLNRIDGIKCTIAQGSIFAFPKVNIPEKAIQEATSRGFAPDAFFCMEMIEQTGICVVPGSGFGQKEGTHHFRTTILPPLEKMEDMMSRLEDFYRRFVAQYS